MPAEAAQLEMADLNDWFGNFNGESIGHEQGPADASRKRAGRPRIGQELRDLIRPMSKENPKWGASRIHGELLMLGFEVAQSTVSKYMVRGRSPSQGWKTFFRNHAQVNGRDRLRMVSKERLPALRWRPTPHHVFRDGRLGDLEA